MAEYSSLKVPELKKLLAEKGLAQTGNKADLIARLQENDKKIATEAAAPGTFSDPFPATRFFARCFRELPVSARARANPPVALPHANFPAN